MLARLSRALLRRAPQLARSSTRSLLRQQSLFRTTRAPFATHPAAPSLQSTRPTSPLPTSDQLVVMLTKMPWMKTKAPFQLKALKEGGARWAESYLANMNNGSKYVVRVSRARQNHELLVNMTASRMGLAPKIHAFDSQNGIIIRDYITDNNHWMININDQTLTMLGNLIKDFLLLPIPAPVYASTHESDVILHHYLTASQNTDSYIATIVKRYTELDQAFASHNTHLIHGDLHPGNILFDGKRFWMHDFEFSRKGPEFLDAALLALTLSLNPEQEKKLLSTIYGDISNQRLIKYYEIKEFCAIRCGILMCGNAGIKHKIPEEQIATTPAFGLKREDFNVNTKNYTRSIIGFYKASQVAAKMRKNVEGHDKPAFCRNPPK